MNLPPVFYPIFPRSVALPMPKGYRVLAGGMGVASSILPRPVTWASSLAEILAAAMPLTSLLEQVSGSATVRSLAEITLLAPIDGQEVWAAGVTYERSRELREQESEGAADLYARVYSAERPELFYKADARRTAGLDGAIKVRPMRAGPS